MSRPIPWLLGAAALALTAGAAFANDQTARQQAAEDSARAQPRAERGDPPRHRHIHRHGGRVGALKDVLQLRPEQEPALQAFLAATRPDERRGEHMVKFDRDEDRSTPQRLDAMETKLAAQQAEAKRRIAAIRAFYGQLDASQKKAFDALPMLMMVGPSMGPMMLPHPVRVAHNMPEPPKPPKPPPRP